MLFSLRAAWQVSTGRRAVLHSRTRQVRRYFAIYNFAFCAEFLFAIAVYSSICTRAESSIEVLFALLTRSQSAHSRAFNFRADLKPENILFSETRFALARNLSALIRAFARPDKNRHIKLTDFGTAKVVADTKPGEKRRKSFVGATLRSIAAHVKRFAISDRDICMRFHRNSGICFA